MNIRNKIFFFNILFNCSLLIYISILLLNLNNLTSEYYINFFNFNLIFDKYNSPFIILTVLIFLFCQLYNYSISKFSYSLSSFLLFLLEIFLLIAFFTNNLLLFFIFFEAILLPFFVYIAFFGSRGRKINAVFLLLLFTIASSLFIFLGIFLIYYRTGNLSYISMLNYNFNNLEKNIILYFFFLGFMAKIPMLPLHIWLTEAHVEAPTVGSVILAAVVLKLGFYGLIRVLSTINFFILPNHFLFFFVSICVCSTLYCSILALRQIDMKKIIAYSSIVHMNIGMLGLCSTSTIGHTGSLFVMFSHGLISAAMFFFIGFLYERFHTRNLMYFGGIVQYMPIFTIFFFLSLISNMSFPGTCNFIGEFLIFYSVYNEFSFYFFIIFIISTGLTSLFCIVIVSKICFFQISGFLTKNLIDLKKPEIFIGLILSILILSFGLVPDLLFCIL
jgi:proton-translocating NADH-quinone oxidoreductase chain M